METFGWLCNTGGSIIYINTQQNAVIVVATDDSIPLMSVAFVYNQIFDRWANYLMSPGNVNVKAINSSTFYEKQVPK